MNTESGNMGVWLNQHERWPPLELSVIARGDCSSTECVIFAHPDGHLSFTVSSSNRQIIEYHSQRIEFFEPVTAFLAANWLNSAADIFLNGQKLLPLSREAPALLVMSSAPTLIANGPISFEASEAELICKQWIEWRHTFFTSTSTVARRGGRRVKSELEQYDELARSQRVLRDLITIGDSGADHVLGCLAAELRALVYWDEKRKHSQYSPLLLRVASKSRTPLPVWSFIVKGYADKAFEELAEALAASPTISFSDLRPPLIKKEFEGQKLADLQAWLDDPIQIIRQEGSSDKTFVSHKDLIHQIASVIGTAHYDEDIPNELHTFRTFATGHSLLIREFILQVSRCIHDLISFVLSRAESTVLPK